MYGSIIGDLAGSIYEFGQIKQISPVHVDRLIQPDSFYSDDTILTIAILDAVLHDRNYDQYLRRYSTDYAGYKPNHQPYFATPFSPSFIKWSREDTVGTSCGNGAMMRIAPIGYLFNDEQTVLCEAERATIPSHNCPESISSAQIVASIIFYARCGLSKTAIMEKIDYHDQGYQPFSSFNATCATTLPNCLYALFTSDSYDEAVRKVISYGGDTDTNACIVGSMAEAMYGLSSDLVSQAKSRLPQNFVDILDKGYAKITPPVVV